MKLCTNIQQCTISKRKSKGEQQLSFILFLILCRRKTLLKHLIIQVIQRVQCKSFRLFLKYIHIIIEMRVQEEHMKAVGSNEPALQLEAMRMQWKREKACGPSSFIAKTYQILESNAHQGVVAWSQEGSSFIILDIERFQQEILPIYFRHRNFSSFVRQLNMYDFHKIRNELNRAIFEHKQFRRNSKHLLKNIKRKGCIIKKASDRLGQASDVQDSVSEQENEHSEKQETNGITKCSIEKESQAEIAAHQLKVQLIDDLVSGLPDKIKSEQELREVIRQMKKDPKYSSLNTKEDVRRIVHLIRNNRMKREDNQGLEELSIEEEIIVNNVDDREQQRVPTLVVLTSEAFLPRRTFPFLCSLILSEELAYPRHH